MALGIPYKLGAEQVAGMVRRLGLGFIYAPAYHPLFAKIGPVRRLLGFRTAFNFLGPVCNPARVKRQVIGVPSVHAMRVIAEVLAELGTERSMVIHTPGPYDEVSLTAPTQIILVEQGRLIEQEFTPEDFGTKTIAAASLAGSDAIGNARRIQDIFNGEAGELRDAICANAACALFVADRVKDVRQGFALAQETIDRGQAMKKLHEAQTYIPEEVPHVLAV
jgi:anthranilate phosphoribosyltransferase